MPLKSIEIHIWRYQANGCTANAFRETSCQSQQATLRVCSFQATVQFFPKEALGAGAEHY